jgi:hypothetical protein
MLRRLLLGFGLVTTAVGCNTALISLLPADGSPNAGSLDAGSLDAGSLDAGLPAASNTPLSTAGWLATASDSYSTSTPNLALDGDPSTSWTVGAWQVPGMWFAVDMGEAQRFYSITMTALTQPADYARLLKLSVSADGQTFTTARTNIAGDKSLVITFSEAEYARYLKFETLETENNWWRIDELSVLQ